MVGRCEARVGGAGDGDADGGRGRSTRALVLCTERVAGSGPSRAVSEK